MGILSREGTLSRHMVGVMASREDMASSLADTLTSTSKTMEVHSFPLRTGCVSTRPGALPTTDKSMAAALTQHFHAHLACVKYYYQSTCASHLAENGPVCRWWLPTAARIPSAARIWRLPSTAK